MGGLTSQNVMPVHGEGLPGKCSAKKMVLDLFGEATGLLLVNNCKLVSASYGGETLCAVMPRLTQEKSHSGEQLVAVCNPEICLEKQ